MTYFVQFFSTILAVMVIAKSYTDYKRHNESLVVFVFWSVTWIGVTTIALFPEIINLTLNRVGSGTTGIGTFLGMGLVFVLFVVYRLYVKMERIEREITKLIKDLALKEIK